MPSFAPVSGQLPRYFVPVTLTNNQTTATQSNLQVLVTVNSNTYSAYEASNLSNVNWQDGNGNILKSWLESGETNTSTATNYWVNLGSLTIPASGSITIYLCFYATTLNVLGTSTGAEPNYTTTYGQYDNGAQVFDFYDNFAGTSLSALWNSSGFPPGNGSFTVNNNLVLSASVGVRFSVWTVATYSAQVLEAYVVSTTGSGELESVLSLLNPAINTNNDTGYIAAEVTAPNESFMFYDINASGHGLGSGAYDGYPGIYGIEWPTTGIEHFTFNYNVRLSFTDSSITWQQSYLTLGSYSANVTFQWARLRKYPPNGVFPTATFGSVSQLVTPLVSDSGHGADITAVTQTRQQSGTGSGSDSVSISKMAFLSISELGHSLDNAYLSYTKLLPTDSGHGTDSQRITNSFLILESGRGTDLPAVLAMTLVADTDVATGLDETPMIIVIRPNTNTIKMTLKIKP